MYDLNYKPTDIILHLDNKASIHTITSPVVANRTKYLDIKVKYLRQLNTTPRCSRSDGSRRMTIPPMPMP